MAALSEGLLRVDPGLMLWTLITFALLLIVLWKAAWRPLIGALDARAEKVRGDVEAAEKSRIEAEDILARHNQMLSKAKEEVSQIISEGKENADKIRNDIITRATSDAHEIVARAYKDIEMAKQKALVELQTEVIIFSTDIASKIIERNLRPEDQRELVEKALGKLNTIQ